METVNLAGSVYIRQGLINWCFVCWMFLVMWMHTASLSVCISHSSQCNTIILFTSNRNHSLLQLSRAVQCLDKIQLADVSASFTSQSWWHFVQVMHSILHTSWDLYELVCISLQLPASGIDSSQISWLRNPDTTCCNIFCSSILWSIGARQSLCPKVKVFLAC